MGQRELWKQDLEEARDEYADDIVILTRTQREGADVLRSITEFITCKLLLRVNEDKSRVVRPWDAKFLGFRVTRIYGVTRTVIHPKTPTLNCALPQSLFVRKKGLLLLG